MSKKNYIYLYIKVLKELTWSATRGCHHIFALEEKFCRKIESAHVSSWNSEIKANDEPTDVFVSMVINLAVFKPIKHLYIFQICLKKRRLLTKTTAGGSGHH